MLFLYSTKTCTFLIIEGICDRWADRRNHTDYGADRAQLLMKSIVQILTPLVPWVAIKYEYFFPLSLLVGSLSIMMDPLAYFYSLVKPYGEFL